MTTTYRFGDFALDAQLYELRRENLPVPMEPQVFDVLLLLVENHDRVVTKDELMEKVWGDKYISEAALNSRVMSARKAVGDTGREQRLIRTVHGRGYRFVAPVQAEGASSPPTVRAEPSTTTALPEAWTEEDGPSMLGRERELAFLHERLNKASQGKRQLVLLGGEAGIGKTTLVNAFLRQLEPAGVRVARGHCLEHRSEGEPYMPMLEALGRICGGPDGNDVLEHVMHIAPTWLMQMPHLVSDENWPVLRQRVVGANRERMLREIGECIDDLTSAKPLVLVLEDLHWSDRSTLDLVDLLARRPDPARLLILATFRPTDLPERHPLTSLVRELSLRGFAEELRLESLSGPAVEAFAESRLGVPVNAATARTLAERTGGNPLYMSMVLDAWQSERGAGNSGDVVEDIPAGIPESLRSYTEQRLALLSEDEREALTVASVAGSEFAAGAIAPAMGLASEAVEETCNSLARLGKFIRAAGAVEWPDGTISEAYVFQHDLYQQVLYEGITSARLARLHQQIGLTLEAAYGATAAEHATELAVHFVRGRVTDKAVLYLRLAGEQALRRSADTEATEHLRKALELLPRLPEDNERRRQEIILRLELGSALIPRRGWIDAESEYNYRTALGLADALGEEDYISAALFANATMHEVRGEYHHAAELMDRRLSLPLLSSPQAPVESCELLACSEFHRGLFEDALVHAEQGVDLYRPDIHGGFATMGESPGVGCYDWAGLSSWFLGDTRQALARVEEALRLAEFPGNQYSLTLARTQGAVLHQLRGEPELTREWAEAAIAAAATSGYPYRVAWGGILLGWARAKLGDPKRGIAEIKDGMEKSLQVGAKMDHAYYQALLADAYSLAGEPDAALAAVDEALQSIRSERSFFYEAEMLRLKGHVLLQGEGEEGFGGALRCFEEALEVARAQGARPLQLRAAIDLLRHAGGEAAGEAKAREILHELIDWFGEDDDLPELKDARALLGV